MTDDSYPFRALGVLVKGSTNLFSWSTGLCRPLPHTISAWAVQVSGNNIAIPFLRFAWMARNILVLLWTPPGCGRRCRTSRNIYATSCKSHGFSWVDELGQQYEMVVKEYERWSPRVCLILGVALAKSHQYLSKSRSFAPSQKRWLHEEWPLSPSFGKRVSLLVCHPHKLGFGSIIVTVYKNLKLCFAKFELTWYFPRRRDREVY